MDKIDQAAMTWIQGAITVQGYLLEILIGARVAHVEKPIEQIEKMRDALQKQIKFDMSLPPTADPQVDHMAIQASASRHLDDLLDRIRTQFENSKQPK